MSPLNDENRWNKGKSFRKYSYTVEDIASLCGRTVGTIRNDVSMGKLKMEELLSVCRYLNKYSVYQPALRDG